MIDIKAKAKDVNLKQVAGLFSSKLQQWQMQVLGQADIDVAYKGNLSSLEDAKYNINSTINSAIINIKDIDVLVKMGKLGGPGTIFFEDFYERTVKAFPELNIKRPTIIKDIKK